MKHIRLVLIAIIGWLSTDPAFSQGNTEITVTHLTGGLYKFTIGTDPYSTNMVASVGEDGVLLVDTGYKQYAQAIKKELAQLGDSLPKIILNTHLHTDHTGNNDSFENDPVILAHANVNRDMMEGRYMLRGLTEKSKPQFVIDQPTSLFFNGEEIRVIPIPGSHSDGDMVVYFTESKVMVTGDIGYGMKYPSYDQYNGNSSLYAEATKSVLEITNDQITYISGHGKDLNREGLRRSNAMLKETIDIVKAEMAKGKDVETIQKEQNFALWQSFEEGYTPKDVWINDIYMSVKYPDRMPTLIPLLDAAYQNQGIEKAVEKFYEVKNEIKKEGIITANLQTYATILYNREQFNDGIAILKILEKDYSNHARIWVNYANLGQSYIKIEEYELARKYLQMSIDINPSEYASSRLEQIKDK